MILVIILRLNMVRAGVVEHPSEWEHGSFNEFIEKTQRCCIINKAELVKSLDMTDFDDFKKWYLLTLDDKLKDAALSRQAFWSKAVAVGDKSWLNEEAVNMGVKRFKVF